MSGKQQKNIFIDKVDSSTLRSGVACLDACIIDRLKTRLLSFEMQSEMMLGNAEIELSATFQGDGAEPLCISFVLDAVYSVLVLLSMVVIPMTRQAQVGSV